MGQSPGTVRKIQMGVPMIEDSDFTLVDKYNEAEAYIQRRIILAIVTLSKWTGYWLVPFAVLGAVV